MGWESGCLSAVLLSRLTTVDCGRRQMMVQAPLSRFLFLAVQKASRARRHGERRLTRLAEQVNSSVSTRLEPPGLIRGKSARYAAPSVCGPCIPLTARCD